MSASRSSCISECSKFSLHSIHIKSKQTFLQHTNATQPEQCRTSYIVAAIQIDSYIFETPLRGFPRRSSQRNTPRKYKMTAMSTTVPTIPRPPPVPHLEYP